MDINAINDFSYAIASGERNEANRGKHVNQKGWVTKEDARKQAAQTAAGIVVFIMLCDYLKQAFFFMAKRYGKAWGVPALLFSILASFYAIANIFCLIVGEPTSEWGAVLFGGSLIALLELKRSKYGEKAIARFGKKVVEIVSIVIVLTLFYVCH